MKANLFLALCSLFMGVFVSAPANAAWSWSSTRSDNGDHLASVQAESNGIWLQLTCRYGDDKDVLDVVLSGGPFPGLPTQDDAETQLIFEFDGTGKSGIVADGWGDFHYFAPDRAWVGKMYMEQGVLDSFGAAATMRVVGNNREIASFSMNGSRKAEQAIRSICHDGQFVSPQAQSTPQPVPAAEPASASGLAAANADLLSDGVRKGVWQIAVSPKLNSDTVTARLARNGMTLTLQCKIGGQDFLDGWLEEEGKTAMPGLEMTLDLELATGTMMQAFAVSSETDGPASRFTLDIRPAEFRAFALAQSMRAAIPHGRTLIETEMSGSQDVYEAMRRVCNYGAVSYGAPDPNDCGSNDANVSIRACDRLLKAQNTPAKQALAFGFRATAKEKMADVAGAIADLREAARLDPTEESYNERLGSLGVNSERLVPNPSTSQLVVRLLAGENGEENTGTGNKIADEIKAIAQRGFDTKKYAEAELALHKFIEGRDPAAFAYFWRGYFRLQMDEYAMAVEDLRIAEKRLPNVLGAPNQLALALYENYEYEESIGFAKQVLAVDENVREANFVMCGSSVMLGRHAVAETFCRKSVELAPESTMPLIQLGVIELHRNANAEAIRYFDEAAARGNRNHGLTGFALQKMGRLEEAAAAYKSALAENPEDYRSMQNLAIVYKDLGEKVQARKMTETILSGAAPGSDAHKFAIKFIKLL